MTSNEENEDVEATESSEEIEAEEKPAKKTSAKKKKAAKDPPETSRDRNKRVREQATRKLEEAKKSAESRASRIGSSGLDTGEMVDDAMARGFAAFTRWIKNNRRSIEFSIGGLILAGVSFAGWDWYSTNAREKASASLMVGVQDQVGIVEAKTDEDKDPAKSEDKTKEEERDPRPRFESYKAMREESLRAYRTAVSDYGRSGPGILARLGEAGVLIESKDYDGAIQAVNDVLNTDLAKADESVRMAAKERMGIALEGKGDEAGALAAYKELEGSEILTYKLYGLYHQGRIALAKGDKEQAKEKLAKVHEQLKGKDTIKSGTNRYLTAQVEAMLRTIDPSLVPAAMPSLGAGGEMTPEKLKELQRELEKLRKNPPVMQPSPPPKPPTEAPPDMPGLPTGAPATPPKPPATTPPKPPATTPPKPPATTPPPAAPPAPEAPPAGSN